MNWTQRSRDRLPLEFD